VQKCKRTKYLLAGIFGVLYFYRAKPVSENPKGSSLAGRMRLARLLKKEEKKTQRAATLWVFAMPNGHNYFSLLTLYQIKIGVFLEFPSFSALLMGNRKP
jgi:hypothetical protein